MAETPEASRRGDRIRFDKTINLGHVGSMTVCLAVIISQFNILDKRISILEELKSIQRERDTAQDVLAKEKFLEVKEALQKVQISLEKINDKLDSKR